MKFNLKWNEQHENGNERHRIFLKCCLFHFLGCLWQVGKSNKNLWYYYTNQEIFSPEWKLFLDLAANNRYSSSFLNPETYSEGSINHRFSAILYRTGTAGRVVVLNGTDKVRVKVSNTKLYFLEYGWLPLYNYSATIDLK